MAKTEDRDFETRRHFLEAKAAAIGAPLLAAAGTDIATPAKLGAETQLTPEAALRELLAGNKRFTSGRMTALDEDL